MNDGPLDEDQRMMERHLVTAATNSGNMDYLLTPDLPVNNEYSTMSLRIVLSPRPQGSDSLNANN